MNNNNNNITGVDVENLTAEEFFALVPQPPLTSSGYPLHFPSMDISSSDSDEDEEEEAAAAATGTNYYNDVSYLQNTGCSNEEEDDDDEEEDDLALYERKRYTSSNGVAVTHRKNYDEDIPMDISDSEDEDDEDEEVEEESEKYKPVPLQRSVRCDGRLPFQELEEGEIDETQFGNQRQTALNSDGFSIENTMWEIDEINLIALLESQLEDEEDEEDEEVQTVVVAAAAVEVDYSDLPDLIPMEVCTEEYIMNHFNKRKRDNEE